MEHKTHIANRWLIAAAGVAVHICMGTVYAWSYFQNDLTEIFKCGHSPVAWVFSLTILCTSIAAAIGGAIMSKTGPRRLAMSGGILFALGYLLAGMALRIQSLMLLYLGYGIVGGTGLGLCYVTPVATVAKWFPDMKGLVTGMVVAGFGFGALLMSKVLAPVLAHMAGGNLEVVFESLGVIFCLIVLPAAWTLKNPPEGCFRANPDLPVPKAAGTGDFARAIFSRKFALMWLVLFCNITTGIMFIGFQSPMLQDILKAAKSGLTAAQLASHGATLIAASSLFNAMGRLFWGALSDRFDRAGTFRILLGTQIIAFELLLIMGDRINPFVFSGLVCYILLCFGGGFGVMPSLVTDAFGLGLMSKAYGAVLTAWGLAGVIGPQIVALIRDRAAGTMAYFYSFSAGTAILITGFLAALMLGNSRPAQPANEKR